MRIQYMIRVAGCVLVLAVTAAAAPLPGDTPSLTDRVNRGLVELMTGGVDGTAARFGVDLAALLDDGATRRVLPVLGKGATQNLTDLRALRGIDLVIVQTDVLEMARKQPGGDAGMTYVAKLYNEELHLLAGRDVARIEDLAGKTVNLGLEGDGTAVTSTALFDLLKIKVEPTRFDPVTALGKLRAGEIAALAVVVGKPATLFASLRASEGLHFLAVPLTPEQMTALLPSQLTAKDYPGVIPADAPVDTIAVGTVMLAANLTPESERARNVAQFVDAFFTQFPKLLEPPHHPKWREINLAAELPGLRRQPAADAWLKRNAGPPAVASNPDQLRNIFVRFLDERSKAATGKTMSSQEKDRLFEQFRQWQSSQAR